MGTTLVCGVDSSTQATKVELRDIVSGELIATASAPHPVTSPPRSEQDPGAWWQALTKALSDVQPFLSAVRTISVAGQQHGLVVLDHQDKVLRPAKLWNDTESAPNAASLVAKLGTEEWAQRCGSVPLAAFTITKLAWLAQTEPQIFEAVSKVMLPHDWLTFCLSGRHVTDRGDASGSGWWSPATGAVDAGLLALVDGDRDWSDVVPQVLEPFVAAGPITTEASASTGLPRDCLVAAGTGDNMAAALGLGLRTGDVVMSLGTSGTVYALSESPSADARGLVAGFADATGAFLPLVCTLNATGVTDVFQRLLGMGRDEFASAALAAPAGANGLVLVPYMDGERTPNLPSASATLLGIRREVTRADVARASHEGVVCGLLDGLDALSDAGTRLVGRFFLVGGGSRSAAYQQIVADLAQRRVRVPNEDQAVAAGACLQAAVTCTGENAVDLAVAWGLGAGVDITPDGSVDSGAIRQRYRAAAEL